MANITVLGGGFGTALAVMLNTSQEHEVTRWSAIPEEIEAMRRDGEQKEAARAILDLVRRGETDSDTLVRDRETFLKHFFDKKK